MAEKNRGEKFSSFEHYRKLLLNWQHDIEILGKKYFKGDHEFNARVNLLVEEFIQTLSFLSDNFDKTNMKIKDFYDNLQSFVDNFFDRLRNFENSLIQQTNIINIKNCILNIEYLRQFNKSKSATFKLARQNEEANAEPLVIDPISFGTLICFYCRKKFTNTTDLHTHLLCYKHMSIKVPEDWCNFMQRTFPSLEVKEATDNDEASIVIDQVYDIRKDENRTHSTKFMKKYMNNDEPSNVTPDRLYLVKMPLVSCNICCKNINEEEIDDHSCSGQYKNIFAKQLNFFNRNGSPWICLICDHKKFSTCSELYVHIAGYHSNGVSTSQCPLCEENLFRNKIVYNGHLEKIALEEHIRQAHYFDIRLKELINFCYESLSFEKEKGIPDEFINQKYFKCLFKNLQAAGEGSRYPFPHWNNLKVFAINDNSVQKSNVINFKSDDKFSKQYKNGISLVQPSELVDRINTHFRKKGSYIHKIMSEEIDMCRVSMRNLTSIDYMTAHIICFHAGSPYKQPKLKNYILKKYAKITEHDILPLSVRNRIMKNLNDHQDETSSHETANQVSFNEENEKIGQNDLEEDSESLERAQPVQLEFPESDERVIFCKACLTGPFKTSSELSRHIEELHLPQLQYRVGQLKRRGHYSNRIDPTKTCLICFKIFKTFLSFQIHILVLHANNYPFVCGICNEPIIVNEFGNSDLQSIIRESIKDIISKYPPEISKKFNNLYHRLPYDYEIMPSYETKTRIDALDKIFKNSIELYELKSIESCLYALSGIHQASSAEFILKSIDVHEQFHVKQFEEVIYSEKEINEKREYEIDQERLRHNKLTSFSLYIDAINKNSKESTNKKDSTYGCDRPLSDYSQLDISDYIVRSVSSTEECTSLSQYGNLWKKRL